MGDRTLVARRIQEVRERKGLTRAELATRLGTTRMQIWRLENGVRRISAEIVPRIAAELGVRVETLYREAGAA